MDPDAITGNEKRRGTTFFQPTKTLEGQDALSLSHGGATANGVGTGIGTNTRPVSRPISRTSSRGSSRTASSNVSHSKTKKNSNATSQQFYFVVHCPLYLRCPTPRDFYTQLTRMQQTIHQRMSLPSIAFDSNGDLDQTYDAYDDDVGPFNCHLYEENSGNYPEMRMPGSAAESGTAGRSRPGSSGSNRPRSGGSVRSTGSTGSAGSTGSTGSSGSRSRVSALGFLGDGPEAKAARERAREMREKLSKTEYMKELEQKTKDCWDGTYQFQEDRSASYRLAPKVAAEKAKQLLLAATRGGKDVVWNIPKLDVRLRMLAPSPKMEWSRRTFGSSGSEGSLSLAGGGVDNPRGDSRMSTGALLQVSGGSGSKSRGSPQRPPPLMKAVTTFTPYDMRNKKDLYRILHGRQSSKQKMGPIKL